MIIKKIIVGALETNCYIVGDESTKEVFIVDPGGDYNKIQNVIKGHSLKVKAVINTHGHGDHIAFNTKFNAPIWIHKDDRDFLSDPSKNLSIAFGAFVKMEGPDRLLEEKDNLTIGKYTLEVIHTPGHTPGSICLKSDGVIFTGDTLFYKGIGRTDFVYGSLEKIEESIREKLFILDENLICYPGHGPSTSIAYEKKHNSFAN